MSDSPKVSAAKAISPKELATELGVDPKTLRRIMRSMTDSENQPGSGGRWEITAEFKAQLAERVARTHHRKTVQFVPKATNK